MNMTLKKLSDSDAEILIEFWKNERAPWDVTSEVFQSLN